MDVKSVLHSFLGNNFRCIKFSFSNCQKLTQQMSKFSLHHHRLSLNRDLERHMEYSEA